MIAFGVALIVSVGGIDKSFDVVALEALPSAIAAATFHGAALRCTGPRLDMVLAAAGAPSGEALKGPALNAIVVAIGADGYRASFALSGLDPLLGDDLVVVATRCGGKPLTGGDGPVRLLADGDRRGARSVRQVRRVELRQAR